MPCYAQVTHTVDPHHGGAVCTVHVLPQVVERALAAGKHVLQEKPVAGMVAAALTAFRAHRLGGVKPLWFVAENYRWEGTGVQVGGVQVGGMQVGGVEVEGGWASKAGMWHKDRGS